MDFFFMDVPNSLLVEILVNDCDKDKIDSYEIPVLNIGPEIKDNLGMISSLYLYTGTPPHGYGTQAPKVAETVKRSYDFNKKKKNKTITIFGMEVQRLHWEKEDGDFPFNTIHGNFIVKEIKGMCTKFLIKNQPLIDTTVDKVMTNIMNSNSDLLTRGKQTFCPFMEKSLPAAQAYKNMYEFLIENGAPTTMSCLEWIQNFMSLFNKDSILYKKKVETLEEKIVFDRETRQRLIVMRPRVKIETKKTESRKETHDVLIHLSTSFASYMKHKERGKKDRRAIASANMIMRMFLYIIESFHLELGKVLEGSTISIGGEEKKGKITTNFQKGNLGTVGNPKKAQGTEDATKWNECLAPAAFAAMHTFLFHNVIRSTSGRAITTGFGRLFSKIAVAGNFLMSLKRIQLGPGVLITNSRFHRRIKWTDEDIQFCNEPTIKWYEEIKHLKVWDDKFLRCSPGMLMGMLNAGSTTLGLIPSNYRMKETQMRVITLRSSDDSMTQYMGRDSETLLSCIAKHRQNLEMVGINLSKEKTFWFSEGYGEYTSWYMDKGFVAQFGVETSSIKPEGINPADDFHNVARQTTTCLSTLTVNHVGAEARLRLGVDGVRRLWRIKRDPHKRIGIKYEVLLLSDGGRSPWNCCNCHLQEVPLKEKLCTSEEEKNYLLRCQNPDNPFSEEIVEELTYSKEHGCVILQVMETPRTIFNYLKVSNRTINKEENSKRAEEERNYGEAVSVAKEIDPTLHLEVPNLNVPISSRLTGILSTEMDALELNEEEESTVRRALDYLATGNRSSDSEDEEMFEDDEIL